MFGGVPGKDNTGENVGLGVMAGEDGA
jgi:hypothetical protein